MTVQEKFKEYLDVDIPKVLAELRISQEAYERVVKISVTTTQKSMLELDTAIQQKNWTAVKSITHDLIGVYANLRIPSLRQPAYKMRQLVDQGQDACLGPLMNDAFKEFSGQFEKLKKIFIG